MPFAAPTTDATTPALPKTQANAFSDAPPAPWHRLKLLNAQLRANLAALSTTNPDLADRLARFAPAHEWLIAAEASTVMLATFDGLHVNRLPNPVNAEAAARVCAKLFPAGQCMEPVLIAGLDQGWIWNTLYAMPVSTPRAPGHRPPLYLLTKDLERLWVILHFHDWEQLLADSRSRIFAGPTCLDQLRESMLNDHLYPWPKTCVTVEPSFWPDGENLDSLIKRSHQSIGRTLTSVARRLELAYGGTDASALAERFATPGSPLRVLGITSRFTTFLQHSMRDWLAAFDALGHATQLVIENSDAEQINSLALADACATFRPDLILMIDHYRGEFNGLPAGVPCVMWVQDQLPNIFSAKAGAAQKTYDYCLGFGRLVLSSHHGYPPERYLPATVGVNEQRFLPTPLSPSELRKFGCDVSYVSHASVPAEQIVADEIARQNTPEIRKLIAGVFDRLVGEYDRHGQVRHALLIRRMIVAAGQELKLNLDAPDVAAVLDFFSHRVNNAIFRHRSLAWIDELGVDLRLYGRGWENHPRFARYAKGIADNATQLGTIYRASKINLQLTPHGAVHQRLMEGLAAGGFFLLRNIPGDTIDLIHKPLWEWCLAEEIDSDEAFRRRMTPEIEFLIRRWSLAMGVEIFDVADRGIVEHLALSADCGFTRSAASVWSEYDRVSFNTRDGLSILLNTYLPDDAERARIAASMRQVVLDRFTYRATSRRLLDFIAADLRSHLRRKTLEIAA